MTPAASSAAGSRAHVGAPRVCGSRTIALLWVATGALCAASLLALCAPVSVSRTALARVLDAQGTLLVVLPADGEQAGDVHAGDLVRTARAKWRVERVDALARPAAEIEREHGLAAGDVAAFADPARVLVARPLERVDGLAATPGARVTVELDGAPRSAWSIVTSRERASVPR